MSLIDTTMKMLSNLLKLDSDIDNNNNNDNSNDNKDEGGEEVVVGKSRDKKEVELNLLNVHKCITTFQALEGKSLISSDIEALKNLLQLAKDIPVTMPLLTSNPTIAKSIKNISKDKDLPVLSNSASTEVKGMMKKLSAQAGVVVAEWKQKITAISTNASATTTEKSTAATTATEETVDIGETS